MIKNFIKKNLDSIIIFLIFFLLIFVKNVCDTNINIDNIWNFHMIQKVSLGYIPYKEINILIPPLFHFIRCYFYENNR